MALTVNNPTAFTAYTNLTRSSNSLNRSMTRLSNGIKSSVDDAAGVGISERMRAQMRGTAMARQNVENGISVMQTADSWMQRINDMVGRMNELAIESGDITMSNDDRSKLNTEFSQLQSEISRVTGTVTFNGTGLLNGGMSGTTQVGADVGQTIAIAGVNLASDLADLTSATVTISTQVKAASAMATINSAIDLVTTSRANIGSQQARLEYTRSGLMTYEDNLRASEGKIRDIDMAKESSEMVKYQIMNQVGNAMLAQANQIPQGIMQLLGG